MKHNYPPEFEELWAIKPKRAGSNSKVKAFKAYKARIKQKYAHNDIKEGLIRFNAFCEKTGKIGTEYVMQLATFFGPDEHFKEDWEPPVGTVAPEWSKIPRDNDELWPFAQKHGFPSPGSMTYSAYRKFLETQVEKRMANGG
jgi:hypothetical protein